MQDTTITYEEAADALGVVPSYVYQLVNAKKLHPIKVPGTNKKRLTRDEIEQYNKSKGGQSVVPVAEQAPLPYPEIPQAPITSITELLSSINAGFAAISHDHERIAEQYKETVSPIVGHVISAPERAVIDEVSRMSQILLNNFIDLLKSPNREAVTPEIFTAKMIQGVDMPDILKARLVDAIQDAFNAVDDLQSVAKAS